MTLRFPPGKHPGSGAVFVICDVCGRKVRRKDTRKVQDKWNLQNNLVVCMRDLDLPNPQLRPMVIKEKLVDNPKLLRSESSNKYAVYDNDNRVPSAPLNPSARGSTLGSSVELFWDGPLDPGSSAIVGYVIFRVSTTDSWYTTTNTNATYYNDTDASVSGAYKYQIAAVNGAGLGAYSNEFYYPWYNPSLTYENYLSISQEDRYILTGDGQYITF